MPVKVSFTARVGFHVYMMARDFGFMLKSVLLFLWMLIGFQRDNAAFALYNEFVFTMFVDWVFSFRLVRNFAPMGCVLVWFSFVPWGCAAFVGYLMMYYVLPLSLQYVMMRFIFMCLLGKFWLIYGIAAYKRYSKSEAEICL